MIRNGRIHNDETKRKKKKRLVPATRYFVAMSTYYDTVVPSSQPHPFLRFLPLYAFLDSGSEHLILESNPIGDV